MQNADTRPIAYLTPGGADLSGEIKTTRYSRLQKWLRSMSRGRAELVVFAALVVAIIIFFALLVFGGQVLFPVVMVAFMLSCLWAAAKAFTLAICGPRASSPNSGRET